MGTNNTGLVKHSHGVKKGTKNSGFTRKCDYKSGEINDTVTVAVLEK